MPAVSSPRGKTFQPGTRLNPRGSIPRPAQIRNGFRWDGEKNGLGDRAPRLPALINQLLSPAEGGGGARAGTFRGSSGARVLDIPPFFRLLTSFGWPLLAVTSLARGNNFLAGRQERSSSIIPEPHGSQPLRPGSGPRLTKGPATTCAETRLVTGLG